ncbi:centrosomal protein of 295 kDa [Patella vulgata]|uniref:centrosomal protein of 295 kDa n=1 Tax=Patella vulgata TaxID=6465 RepID=UPI00217FD8F5|nr:centrosomal protein of 295 kDa [Patella vulgata]XP_050416609.1 centrosomal protein of 295 kDa [Patella vulgata]
MKGKGTYRISPNEENRLVKEETEKRRKLRLIQVREQAKQNAKTIREDVRKEKEKQLIKLARMIENDLERDKIEKIRQLEDQYQNTLKNIGQGHKEAQEHSDGSFDRLKKKLEAQEQATKRHMKALEKMKNEKLLKQLKENKGIMSRKAAIAIEKYRAAEIAALPPPPKDPVEDVIQSNKPVLMTDMNAFSATHYHMPEYAVIKANQQEQKNAKLDAEDEDFRIQENVKERERMAAEQTARAKIRGTSALKKEHLKHEYDALVEDLSLLQRADRKRRQDIVANLPKQVFIPPARRIVEKDQKQRNMEKDFEDLYMDGNERCKDDLLISMEPEPATPTASDVLDLSVHNTPVRIPTVSQTGQISQNTTNTAQSEGESVDNGKRETVLKKLLNRIKEQKDAHTSRSKLETSHLDVPSTHTKQKKIKPKKTFSTKVKEYDVEQYQQMWEEVTSLSEYSMSNKNEADKKDRENGTKWHQLEENSPSVSPSPSPVRPSPCDKPTIHKSPVPVKKDVEEKSIENELQFQELLERIQKIEEQKLMLEEKIKLQEEEKKLREVQTKMVTEQLLTRNVPIQLSQPVAPVSQTHGPTFAPRIPDHTFGTVGHQSYPVQHYPAQIMMAPQGDSYPHSKPQMSYQPQLTNEFQTHSMGSSVGQFVASKPPSSVYPSQQTIIGQQVYPQGPTPIHPHTYSVGATPLPLSMSQLSYSTGHRPVIPPASNFDYSGRGAVLFQPYSNYAPPPPIDSNIGSRQMDQLRKVREYQNKLLETNEKRKELLAKSREDLKKRREELNEKVSQDHQQQKESEKPVQFDKNDKSAPSNKLESIRKSLPFDEEDSFLGIQIGKDEDLESEAGDALASCSERGSPQLDNTNRSVVSSGPGSSLIALAEERQKFCETRQQELKNQLEEIQKQKNDIMQKYHQGQEKIQEQRFSFHSKVIEPKSKEVASTSKVKGASKQKSPPKETIQLENQVKAKLRQMTDQLRKVNTEPVCHESSNQRQSTANMSIEEGDLSQNDSRSKRLTWAELLQAETEKEALQQPPPVTRGYFLVDNHDHHQLSTIEEVATPLSQQKASPGQKSISGTSSSLPAAKRALEFSSKSHVRGSGTSHLNNSQISGIGGRLSDQLSHLSTPASRLDSLESGELGYQTNSEGRSSSLTRVTERTMDSDSNVLSEGPLSFLLDQQRLSVYRDSRITPGSLDPHDFMTPALSRYENQSAYPSINTKQVESVLSEAKQYNEELMNRIREHTKQAFDGTNQTSSISMSLEELSMGTESDSPETLEEYSIPG